MQHKHNSQILIYCFYLGLRPVKIISLILSLANRKVVQKRDTREKNTRPPASRTWLVSNVTLARLEPTAVRLDKKNAFLATYSSDESYSFIFIFVVKSFLPRCYVAVWRIHEITKCTLLVFWDLISFFIVLISWRWFTVKILSFWTDRHKQTVQTPIRVYTVCHSLYNWAATWENLSSGVCDQIRLKPACSAKEVC